MAARVLVIEFPDIKPKQFAEIEERIENALIDWSMDNPVPFGTSVIDPVRGDRRA